MHKEKLVSKQTRIWGNDYSSKLGSKLNLICWDSLKSGGCQEFGIQGSWHPSMLGSKKIST